MSTMSSHKILSTCSAIMSVASNLTHVVSKTLTSFFASSWTKSTTACKWTMKKPQTPSHALKPNWTVLTTCLTTLVHTPRYLKTYPHFNQRHQAHQQILAPRLQPLPPHAPPHPACRISTVIFRRSNLRTRLTIPLRRRHGSMPQPISI